MSGDTSDKGTDMADPTKYEPHFNYSGWEAAGPKRPKPGAELDIDFANIARSIDETIDALKDIRRSDGKLKNGIVDKDALDASTVELWESAETAATEAAQSAQAAAGSASGAAASAELARQRASDAVSQGNVPIYSTAQSVEGLEIPAGITAFRTNGYASLGDGGGALYIESDSTSGTLQSGDGRWWALKEPVVSYAMFGADLTGQTPADDAMKACHDYANATGAKVQQKVGTVLWRNTEIEVKTDCDLSGLVVRMDELSGSTESDYGPTCYRIMRTKEPIYATEQQRMELETTYNSQMKKGSRQLTHPLFLENPFSFVYIRTRHTYMLRNGSSNIIAQEQLVTGLGGNLSHGFTMDCDSVSVVALYPKEDSYLTFRSPHFVLDSAGKVGCIMVERNQTVVEMATVSEINRQGAQRRLFHTERAWDVHWKGLISPAMRRGDRSSYVMGADNVVSLKFTGFRSWSGWGATGMNRVKDVTFEDCDINRYDVHAQVWGMTLNRCRVINGAFRLSGGGPLRVRDMTVVLTGPGSADADGDNRSTALFSPREDFACYFDGTILIDGLHIELGSEAELVGDYTIVRTGAEIDFDPGRDITLPQHITVKNVTVDVADGLAERVQPFSLYVVYLEGHHTNGLRTFYWPRSIVVDNVKFVNAHQGKEMRIIAVRSFSFAKEGVKVKGTGDTAARFGTTATVRIKDVFPIVNTSYRAHEGWGLVAIVAPYSGWSSDYENGLDGWFPRISIQDCPHVWLDLICKATVQVDRSVIHRGDSSKSGPAPISFRATSCDIKPVDRAEGSGSSVFDLVTGENACYVGCAFYEPLDDAGAGGGSVSLTNTRGVGNYLVDADATNYPNAPSGFFLGS